ncbi:Oidioi.mRNA.OKI2018_I69.chr2.g6471.t1.cds [Oikopleura dioica]|uniref:UNC93-like protein MFSD11 n=1 Tax=Oikopleura dioica TaxID=34765 RepID=A0ABN7TA36_OIKDI|nr:Oidioi.mRNA.OKI2018_I69.chr2.g6471.t1.cds [Oikopleura dioica]
MTDELKKEVISRKTSLFEFKNFKKKKHSFKGRFCFYEMGKDWKLINVVLLGLGFMLVFTAFQTTSMVGKYVTNSVKQEKMETPEFNETFVAFKEENYDEYKSMEDEIVQEAAEAEETDPSTYNATQRDALVIEKMKSDLIDQQYGDGFTSMSIVYAVFALSNFTAPAVVKLFGHKATMFVAGLTYLLYIITFLNPTPVFLYTASFTLGFGAAYIWTAQGDFLHLQSPDEKLMSRNTGIFWCMFQTSLLIGNIYIMIAWKGESYVSSEMRTTLFTIFAILASVGCSIFLLLKGKCCGPEERYNAVPVEEQELQGENEKKTSEEEEPQGAINTITSSIQAAFKLLVTKKMLLIAPLFMYSGFELSYFSGVHPTTVGNSKNMADSSSAVGMAGLFVGIGEVLGGGIFVFGAKMMENISRTKILMGCCLLHIAAYALSLLNYSFSANLDPTDNPPSLGIFSETSRQVAIAIAFLLGLGDAGVNNVIYTSITKGFPEDTTSAFALMKFIQSATCALCFFISNSINLFTTIAILLSFLFISVATFIPFMRSVTEPPNA